MMYIRKISWKTFHFPGIFKEISHKISALISLPTKTNRNALIINANHFAGSIANNIECECLIDKCLNTMSIKNSSKVFLSPLEHDKN